MPLRETTGDLSIITGKTIDADSNTLINIPRLIVFPNVGRLATDPTNVTLFTVPTGKNLLVMFGWWIATTIAGFVSTGQMRLEDGNANVILNLNIASAAVDEIGEQTHHASVNSATPARIIPSGGILRSAVTTPAVATTYNGTIVVLGYLY